MKKFHSLFSLQISHKNSKKILIYYVISRIYTYLAINFIFILSRVK